MFMYIMQTLHEFHEEWIKIYKYTNRLIFSCPILFYI